MYFTNKLQFITKGIHSLSSREEKLFCLPFYQSAILGCQMATLENQGFY